MTFAEPVRLWLFAALAILAALYLIQQRRRPAYVARFTNLDLLASVAPKRPGTRRHLPALLFLLGGAAMILGIAEPEREVEVPSDRSTVVLALDTSLSMAANDVLPDRISAAKQAAIGFIESVPDTALVGIVEFNGVARTTVSPTDDRALAADAVSGLQLGEATAIGEAIFASLDAVIDAGRRFETDHDSMAPPALIVVMSDGETTTGRSNDEAVDAANQAGVAVTTISFGTADGQIVLPGDPLPIPVPVNHDQLEAIARATGGEFFPAADADELVAAFADIGTGVSTETETEPVHLPFFATGMALLLVMAVLGVIWFSRIP